MILRIKTKRSLVTINQTAKQFGVTVKDVTIGRLGLDNMVVVDTQAGDNALAEDGVFERFAAELR